MFQNLWPFSNLHNMNLDWVLNKIAGVNDASEAVKNMTAEAVSVDPSQNADVIISGGSVEHPYNMKFLIPKGQHGEAAKILSTVVEYQVNTSGTIIPTGTWLDAVPNVPQGSYMWTRSQLQYETDTGYRTMTWYSVTRSGLDGAGSVSSVDGMSPDAAGNVALHAVRSINGSEPDASGELALSFLKPASVQSWNAAVSISGPGSVSVQNQHCTYVELGNIIILIPEISAEIVNTEPTTTDLTITLPTGVMGSTYQFPSNIVVDAGWCCDNKIVSGKVDFATNKFIISEPIKNGSIGFWSFIIIGFKK